MKTSIKRHPFAFWKSFKQSASSGRWCEDAGEDGQQFIPAPTLGSEYAELLASRFRSLLFSWFRVLACFHASRSTFWSILFSCIGPCNPLCPFFSVLDSLFCSYAWIWIRVLIHFIKEQSLILVSCCWSEIGCCF